ncbi:MAG: hypothetical protein JOZ81_19830 [Chloroflexi bacterium]|nr:hypothetical protein [Chloroflexota bacterium]
MLHTYWNRLAVLGGAAALLAIGVVPASAAGVCAGTRVPAFESPDITLTPDSSNVWSSPVTIKAYCEDFANPSDTSMPLANVSVSGVSVVSADAVPDLQASVSPDGKGAFQSVPDTFPGAVFQMSGLTTDASGNATFTMRATSTSHPFLGGANGAAQLIGAHFDYSTGLVGKPVWFVMPDEGKIFAQTPELDSLVLLGSGALGMLGYATMRMRGRRRS